MFQIHCIINHNTTVLKITIKRDHAQKISVKSTLGNCFSENIHLTEKMLILFSVKITNVFLFLISKLCLLIPKLSQLKAINQ